MVTHTFVNIDLKEAAYLADLTGIESDLRSTIELCNKLLDISDLSDQNIVLLDTLSTTISVRYSRSFVSGVRKKLNIKNIESITERLLEEHERILAIRNKHIAHSVNAFEENQVVGYYIEETLEEKGITSISAQHGHIIGLNHNDAVMVIRLSNLVLEYVNAEIKNEKEKILGLVRQSDITSLIKKSSKRALLSNIDTPDKRRR